MAADTLEVFTSSTGSFKTENSSKETRVKKITIGSALATSAILLMGIGWAIMEVPIFVSIIINTSGFELMSRATAIPIMNLGSRISLTGDTLMLILIFAPTLSNWIQKSTNRIYVIA